MSVRSMLRGYPLRTLCAFAGGVLVLSGCTNSELDENVPKVSVQRVDAIAAQVPEKVAQAGRLVVGVNVPYQPNEYRDSRGQIIGFDVDLMDAVAAVMGVRAGYVESAFEKIIPAIQSGTYDVGMSSITVSAERQQQVDFTSYFTAGVQWAQRAGKPVDPDNACGKKVAVQATTVEHTDEVPAKSAACEARGEPAIDIKPFDEQTGATNALVLGQVDAMSADSPVTAYALKKTEGQLEKAGPVFDAAPYGWAVPKGSPLGDVLRQAVQHLIDNGQYAEIAKNWGVEEGAIERSVVNGAVS